MNEEDISLRVSAALAHFAEHFRVCWRRYFLTFAWAVTVLNVCFIGVNGYMVFKLMKNQPKEPDYHPEKFRFETMQAGGPMFVRQDSVTGEIDMISLSSGNFTWVRVMYPEYETRTWNNFGNVDLKSLALPKDSESPK
jgi:hypothetical protein